MAPRETQADDPRHSEPALHRTGTYNGLVSQQHIDRHLVEFARQLNTMDTRLVHIQQTLDTLLASLVDEPDADEEDLRTLEGEPMGKARDQSESL